MSPDLSDLALRPAVLRREVHSEGLTGVDISVTFAGKRLSAGQSKFPHPFLWEGPGAPQVVRRQTSGGKVDPKLFEVCQGAEMDLTPRGLTMRSLAMEGPKDLRHNLNLLREATRGRVPVWVRMACGDVYDDLKIALKAGADGVLLDPSIGGGLPLIAALAPARRALDELGGDKAKLPKLMVVAGPDQAPEAADHVKLLALGADMIHLDRPLPIAEVERLAREVARLVGLCGHRTLAGLSSEDLYALSYDTAALTGLRLAGYDSRIPMWSH